MKREKVRYFRDRLKEDFQDPKFRKHYVEERNKLDLAIKIVELRKKQGLTQRELAKRMSASQQVVSRIENGKNRNLTVNTLIRVAAAADHTIDIQFVPKANE